MNNAPDQKMLFGNTYARFNKGALRPERPLTHARDVFLISALFYPKSRRIDDLTGEGEDVVREFNELMYPFTSSYG